MTDKHTVLAVVLLLGFFAVVGLASTVFLIDHDKDASNIAIVAGMTGTALGSLATMLASTKSTASEAQNVQVVNKPQDALPVEEVEEERPLRGK